MSWPKCRLFVQIEWLLKDEVASAIRYRQLKLDNQTLRMVAQHVKDSEGLFICQYRKLLLCQRRSYRCLYQSSVAGRSTCIYSNIALQYVCGNLNSHSMFIKEFEKMKIPKYKLEKEKDYYYLKVNSITVS